MLIASVGHAYAYVLPLLSSDGPLRRRIRLGRDCTFPLLLPRMRHSAQVFCCRLPWLRSCIAACSFLILDRISSGKNMATSVVKATINRRDRRGKSVGIVSCSVSLVFCFHSEMYLRRPTEKWQLLLFIATPFLCTLYLLEAWYLRTREALLRSNRIRKGYPDS